MSAIELTTCRVYDLLQIAARTQDERARQEPALELGYYQAGFAIRQVLHHHAKSCPECVEVAQ